MSLLATSKNAVTNVGKLTNELINIIGKYVGKDDYKMTVHPKLFSDPTVKKPWPQSTHVNTCPAGKAVYSKLAWLVDTGSPFDLSSAKALGKDANRAIESLNNPISLNTANGLGDPIKKCVRMRVKSMRENIKPLLLPDTPFVLSIGLRCMELGYDFHWMRYTNPYFVLPGGAKVNLKVVNNVPYLFDDDLTEAAALRQCDGPVESDVVTVVKSDRVVEAVPAHVTGRLSSEVSPMHVSAPGEEVICGICEDDQATPPAEGAESDDPAEREIRKCVRKDLKAEAKTLRHMLLHRPYNQYCATCRRAKCRRAYHRSHKNRVDRGPRPRRFGDQITCDAFLSRKYASRGWRGENVGLVMYDRATKFYGVYPKASKSMAHMRQAYREFWGVRGKPKMMYHDNAPELIATDLDLGWAYETSTQGVSETNAIAERSIQEVVDGASASLEQAGFFPEAWPVASPYYACARNFNLEDGDSAYNKRFRQGHFPGVMLPLGALCDFIPQKSKAHREADHAPKAIPGLFLGWKLGLGSRWHGAYHVLDLKEIDSNDYRGSLKRALDRMQTVEKVFDPTLIPGGSITFPGK